jgi:hypothetical protein
LPVILAGDCARALWLLALGAATAVAHAVIRRWTRALALALVAAITGASLWWTVHGGGVHALLLVLIGWAALTALASGVVRSLRLTQAAAPAPPVAAASLGALCAGLVLGDTGDLPSLVARLAAFVGVVASCSLRCSVESTTVRAPGCRAGLFDCSLPAWPAGAGTTRCNGRRCCRPAMLPMRTAADSHLVQRPVLAPQSGYCTWPRCSARRWCCSNRLRAGRCAPVDRVHRPAHGRRAMAWAAAP